MAISTGAALIISAVIGAGTAAVQGERQNRASRRSNRLQEQAQDDARRRGAAETRRQQEEMIAAQDSAPDVASLLADEAALERQSTLLSGYKGRNRLGAGQTSTSLLGE